MIREGSICEECGHRNGEMVRPELRITCSESGEIEFNEHAEVVLVDGVGVACNSPEEALVLYRQMVEIYRGRASFEDWIKENT